MTLEKSMMPDYLFEVSWEVCNKVGGIHTVVATKSLNLDRELKKNHILVGPDVWMDTEKNPEFIEDPSLFKTWRLSAAQEELRIRVGRWNIPGNPIVILVDFTQFFRKKDEILTNFWKEYGLDSISGQWDYIEAALFGYAAGKAIESFFKYNMCPHHKAVAQFHEWMTGAGLLYLKSSNLPIATVFTTHATVVGRSLACNNVHLYDSMELFDGDEKARELNVTAKHSLEKCSANNCDIFTTVSDITAKEALQFLGRKVDFVTPNGFETDFTPEGEKLKSIRTVSRNKLIEVASFMIGENLSNPFIVGISGRYEYKNKGIDLFLDVMDKLNSSDYNGREILAFIMVPAGNNGPNRELVAKMGGNESKYVTNITHYLSDPETDVVINKLHASSLSNSVADRVKVLFVPTYLDGSDGLFNMSYYDLLAGFDLTLFPSYYEPWGYTPLESLAFKVPTITTSLTGFGVWVREHYKKEHPSISVIERNDQNYDKVVEGVLSKVVEMSNLDFESMEKCRENAKEVASVALWSNNIIYYKRAYSAAVEKVVRTRGAFPECRDDKPFSYQKIEINKPSWNRVIVTRQVPERLKHLDTLSKNLWWCWNEEAIELFRSIDAKMWRMVDRNPIALLDMLSLRKYKELENNSQFLERLDRVYADFSAYMEKKTQKSGPSISYFSMEYGLSTSLKIYSGGLGILAGDYLKESSDMLVDMTGVGLLYRYGYFKQQLSAQGDQEAKYEPQDFLKIPAFPVRDSQDKWLTVSVAFPGRNINARIWRVDVGRTELYLLDTDYEDNLPEDREVTHYLYGGNWENRLKQELLLGIGGIRALRVLGIKTNLYHCNEGHAAFIGLERLREYVMDENLSYGEALEVVRSSSLFTTHTPVPAGHDSFSEDMLRTYISHYPARLKVDWTALMALGKIEANNNSEKFSMSNLACNLSQEVNGVSWLHGKVSREILSGLWPGYLPEELHVGYVTNGVHYPTWAAPQWKKIHSSVFGESFATHHYDKDCFQGIYNVDDAQIWDVRTTLRKKLIEVVKSRLSDSIAAGHYSPRNIVQIKETLRDDILTIGFARRFATYKRAHLLFRNLDKLEKIVNNKHRPVQFLFAGKAHPADKAGQDLIKRIIEISKMPQFVGKVVFIPNYDINLAKSLVQGVDVWMNTPTRPLEASGTSGEKAVMNGVMHFSVLDGWWVEGYKEGAGWALPMERTYDNQDFQDELDAATIYNIIENEISTTFYNIDRKKKIPTEWIQIIKNTIANVACNFTTNRMLGDYIEKYYNPLFKRTVSLQNEDYTLAREIAFWKRRMRREWSNIEVVSFVRPNDGNQQLILGKESMSEIKIRLGDIAPEDIGIELVYSQQDSRGKFVISDKFPFELVGEEDGVMTYQCRVLPNSTGVYDTAGRIFAKNDLLPHRQDFELVKWL